MNLSWTSSAFDWFFYCVISNPEDDELGKLSPVSSTGNLSNDWGHLLKAKDISGKHVPFIALQTVQTQKTPFQRRLQLEAIWLRLIH